MPPELPTDEVAARAARLLSAPAAAVVADGEVLGTWGLDEEQRSELASWVATDPGVATAWEGGLRRVAHAPWPVIDRADVWVLDRAVRRLPGTTYDVLADFLRELSAAA